MTYTRNPPRPHVIVEALEPELQPLASKPRRMPDHSADFDDALRNFVGRPPDGEERQDEERKRISEQREARQMPRRHGQR